MNSMNMPMRRLHERGEIYSITSEAVGQVGDGETQIEGRGQASCAVPRRGSGATILLTVEVVEVPRGTHPLFGTLRTSQWRALR